MASSHDPVLQQNNKFSRVTDGHIKSQMKNQFTLKLFMILHPGT